MRSLSVWQEMIPFSIFGVIGVCWVFPLLFVLVSGRSQGGAKFGWFLMYLFFSWVGFAVFLIVTQHLKPPSRHSFLNERREPR